MAIPSTRYARQASSDPFLAERAEQMAAAVERSYRRLAIGTLRTKGVAPERLAMIFTAIAGDLVERADAFVAPPVPVDEDGDE